MASSAWAQSEDVLTPESPLLEPGALFVPLPPQIFGYDPAQHAALLSSPPGATVNPNFWGGRPPTGIGYSFTLPEQNVVSEASTVGLIDPQTIVWATHYNRNWDPRLPGLRPNTIWFYDEQGNEYVRSILPGDVFSITSRNDSDISTARLNAPLPPSIVPLPIARTVFPGSRVLVMTDAWSAGFARASNNAATSPVTAANEFRTAQKTTLFNVNPAVAGQSLGLRSGDSGSPTIVRAPVPGGYALVGPHSFSFVDGNIRREIPRILGGNFMPYIPTITEANPCPDFDGNNTTDIFDLYDWLGFYARWDPMATPPDNDLAAANVTPPAWMDINDDGMLDTFDFFDFLDLLEHCGANMNMIPSASMFIGYEPWARRRAMNE